jgi:hypothetical protein
MSAAVVLSSFRFLATAEEAKALVGRALDRVPDDELQRVLDQLASCTRVKSDAQ